MGYRNVSGGMGKTMSVALEIISIILLILSSYDAGYRIGVHTERRCLTDILIQSIKDDLNRRYGAGEK